MGMGRGVGRRAKPEPLKIPTPNKRCYSPIRGNPPLRCSRCLNGEAQIGQLGPNHATVEQINQAIEIRSKSREVVPLLLANWADYGGQPDGASKGFWPQVGAHWETVDGGVSPHAFGFGQRKFCGQRQDTRVRTLGDRNFGLAHIPVCWKRRSKGAPKGRRKRFGCTWQVRQNHILLSVLSLRDQSGPTLPRPDLVLALCFFD